MAETSLGALVRGYLKDSFELGARLPVPGDHSWNPKDPPQPSNIPIQGYGFGSGTVTAIRSDILGSLAYSTTQNATKTEIARIRPFHPDIPPIAAFYQIGNDGITVSVSPGRTVANKLDHLIISFNKFYMESETPHIRGDAWISIDPTGTIREMHLPPNTNKDKVASRAREALQAIRDGKSIINQGWVRWYAGWHEKKII